MKKLLVMMLLLSILFVSACSNVSSFDEVQNNERSVEKISFDVTYHELLQKFSDNNFQFSEIGVKSFDDNVESFSF